MRVLAGDCGGTNTRLGIFALEACRWRQIRTARFRNAEAESFEQVVLEFLGPRGSGVEAGCVAVAGPVTGRVARLTNLPWVVDADAIEKRTGIQRIELINDLEAAAWAVPVLGEADTETLNAGAADAVGNGAVIAAGTGLGEAGLFWDGDVMRPFATEGGHSSFSPTDPMGDDLLRYLRLRFKTVSWERVLSGPGLADLYRFMLEAEGRPEPDWFTTADAAGDPVPSLSRAGIEGTCETCRATLRFFARLYGEESGNLALKVMARGGVWIAGGIAPKILPVLQDGSILRSGSSGIY